MGLGVVVLLLAILVLLAPVIISTGVVRRVVIGKVNDSLNGQIKLADWSIGWNSGVEVKGLEVRDAQGNVILSVPRVFTGLSLIDAAKGNFDLGTTILENPTFHLTIDEDGKVNLSGLVKPSEQAETSTAGEKKGALPNIKGTIKIENPTGTVVAAGIEQTLKLNGGSVVIRMPSLDGVISDEIKLVCAVGDRPEGTIALSGTAQVLEHGEFNPQALKADQKLAIQNLDTAAVMPFLKLAKVDLLLGGMADAQLQIKAEGLEDVSADGSVNIADLSAGGGVLNGDTFKSRSVAVPVQLLRQAGQIKANLGVEMDAGKLAVVVDAPQGTLEQIGPMIADAVAANLRGGSTGRQAAVTGNGKVELSADLDVAAIVNQLPNTIRLIQGTRLTGGRLSHRTLVEIADGGAKLTTSTRLTETAGIVQGHNGALRPVEVDAAMVVSGGDRAELRDINLKIASGFANISAGGQTLQKLEAAGKIDLAGFGDEVGQFVQLDAYLAPVLGNLRGQVIEVKPGQSKLKLGGIVELSAGSSGDLVGPAGRLQTQAQVTVTDLQLTGLGEEYDINEPGVVLAYSGMLEKSDSRKQAQNTIRDAMVVLKLGPLNNPTVDLTAGGDVALSPFAMPRWEIKGLRISPGAAQQELGPVLAVLEKAGLRFEGGQLLAQAKGSYDGNGVVFQDLVVNPVGVILAKYQQGRRRVLLENFTLKLDAGGQMKTAGGLEVQLSKLVMDSPELLHIQKVGDAELVVKIPESGEIQPSGKLQVAADLGRLNTMLRKIDGGEVAVQDKAGELRSGKLAGVVQVSPGEGSQLVLGADIQITNLGITTANRPIENEKISLVLKGSAERDFSAFSAESMTIDSSFANAKVSDARVRLKDRDGKAVSLLEMVRAGQVAVEVADLPRLQGMIEAIMPPTVKVEGPEASAGPLVIQRGSMAMQIDITQQDDATIINLFPKAKDVVLERGAGSYALKPVDLKVGVELTAAKGPPDPQASLMDQISQLRLTQLDGSAGVATVSLPEAMVIKNPGRKMAASGSIHVNGELVDLSRFMDLLQGKRVADAAYAGQLEMVQNLSTQGEAISLNGNLRIQNFRVRDNGREVLNEKTVRLVNDLVLDQQARSIDFKDVSLEMPSSKTAALKLTGRIDQYDTQRKFEDVQADLTYDLAKIWQVVQPMMARPGETSDLVIAGSASRSFRINGTYPAQMPFHQAIRSLEVSGSIAVAQLQTSGLTFENLDFPLLLKEGKLTVESAIDVGALQKKPIATCNGGQVDLSGMVVDLGQEHPRISIPKDHVLIHQMRLNSVLANTALGDITPLFADPQQVNGLVDLTVVECDQLPLDSLMTQQSSANNGRVEVLLSVSQLNIINQFANFLMGIFDQQALAGRGLQGNIKNARITLENGVASQDMVFELGRYPLAFSGKVGLANQRLMPLNITLPPGLLRMIDKNLIRYLPEGITIPITGTTRNFQVQLDQVIPGLIAEAGKRALIEGLGGNRNRRDNQVKPGERKKDEQNPLGGLEELLGGNQEKKQ